MRAGSEDEVIAGTRSVNKIRAGIDVIVTGIFMVVQSCKGKKSRPAQNSLARLRKTPAL